MWGPHTLGADSGGEQQGPIWRALLRLASSQLALHFKWDATRFALKNFNII